MLKDFTNTISNFILSMGAFAPIFSCLLICVESILPVLPLSLFITINFVAFGEAIGFIISWICTILGCLLSYYLVKKGFRNFAYDEANEKKFANKIAKKIKNVSFPMLTCIIAMPFTPAFAINIAAGIVKIDFKKFFPALLIGKISLVYFWGYVGTSLIESFSNPFVLIRVVIIVSLAYLISFIINKKINK